MIMNRFCPNLSNPQVKQEFSELVQAVGENEAYFLWDKNNGYALDKAPNGADSKLFNDLVKYCEGDRIKALQIKSRVYSDAFKEWFGDWLADIIKPGFGRISSNYILKDDNSIDFDKLEEITDKYFNDAEESLFKKGRKTLRTRQEHHKGEANTLEHLQNVVSSAQNIDVSDNLKQSLILAAALHDIAKPFHGGQLHGYQSVDVINEIFDDSISPLIKFAVRHHMMTTIEGSQFDQNDANKIIQDAIDNNLNLKDAIELLLALNTADIVRGRDLSEIDQYSNKTIKETLEQEIPYKRQLLENAVDVLSINGSNVSKVVDKNGEPQIVWHGTEWEFNTFELDTENKRGRHKVHPNVAVGWFTDRRDKAAKYHSGLIQMPVFLNFKNPGYSNVKDFKTFQAATENESRILLDDNYDSAIIVRFDKEGDKNGFIPTPQWAAKHANQIKSIENKGTWSKTNDDIYKYRLPEHVMQLTYSTANVCGAQIFFGDSDIPSSKQILSNLIDSRFVSDSQLDLAQVLQNHDIPVVAAPKNANYFMLTIHDKKNRLVISVNRNLLDKVSGEFASRVFMHEMIHALTVHGLQNKLSNFHRYTMRMYNTYRKYFGNQVDIDSPLFYGLNDEYEFVAEFITNKDFKQQLIYAANELDKQNEAKYAKMGTFKRMFNKFVDAVVNFFCNKSVIPNSKDLEKYSDMLYNYVTSAKHIKQGNFKSSEAIEVITNSINPQIATMEDIIDNHKAMYTLMDKIDTHAYKVTDKVQRKIDNYLRGHEEVVPERWGETLINKELRYTTKSDIQKNPEDLLNDISKQIATALDIRKKAVKASNMADFDKNQLLQGLDAQIEAFKGDAVDRVTSVAHFLDSAYVDLIDSVEHVLNAVNQIYQTGISPISHDEYMSEMHDNFGVYLYIFTRLNSFMTHQGTRGYLSEYREGDNTIYQAFDAYVDKLQSAIGLINTAINQLAHIRQHNILETLKQIGISTNNVAEIQNFIDTQMGNVMTDETYAITRMFGAADKAENAMIRGISYLINKAVTEAGKESLEKIRPLLDLQDALKGRHRAFDLYEKDDDGLPTGNLVRSRNFGKAEKEYKEFLAELNAKYSTPEEPLDPNNEIPPENPETRKKWQLERNEYLDVHYERFFTKEYYDQFANLSYEAYTSRNSIQMQINDLHNKGRVYTDHGDYFDFTILSESDQIKLKELETLRRRLASPYYPDGTEKLEGTKDREIADELSALNKSLYGKNEGKKDRKLWEELRNKAIARFEEDAKNSKDKDYVKKKLAEWDSKYSHVSLKRTEDGEGFLLWEDVEKARQAVIRKFEQKFGKQIIYEMPEEYVQNREMINRLQSVARDANTGEIRAENLTNNERVKILKLQKENSKILKLYKKNLKYADGTKIPKNVKNQIFKEIKKVNESFYTTEYTEEFQRGYEEARRLDAKQAAESGVVEITDNTNVSRFLATHGTRIFDYDGNPIAYKAYSYYTKIVPKDADKYVTIEPSNAFIIQDQDSPFINKNFDQEQGEYKIPKKSGTWKGKKFNYDNSQAYNEIMQNEDLKNLYGATVELLKEVAQTYSNVSSLNPYKLPSIQRGFFSQTRGKNAHDKFEKAVQLAKRQFIINDQDIDANEVAATRPDNRELSFIPQPYIARMQNPETISSDLVMIMYEYYLRAMEYKHKKKIQNACESMLDQVGEQEYVGKDTAKHGTSTQTYQMMQDVIKTQLYAMRERQGSVGKTVGVFGKMASALNLGLNMAVAGTGLFTAQTAHLMNAFEGQKYGVRETANAFIEVVKSLVQSNLGYRILGCNSRLFQQNLMEFFNVSEQGTRKFRDTNMNRLIAGVKHNWLFGMMTMADYLIKSQILDSVLMSFRFVDGEFITKDMIVNKYYKMGTFTGGDEYKAKIRQFEKSKNLYAILKQSHNKKKGELFTIPKEYKQAFENAYYTITSRAQKYAAYADGTVTPAQKSFITFNYAGALIMMHRQYFPVMIQQRFGATVYDFDTQAYQTGVFRALLDIIGKPVMDGYRAYKQTAEENPSSTKRTRLKQAVKTANKSGIKHILAAMTTPTTRWAINRTVAELVYHNTVTVPLTTFIVNLANSANYDDDTLLQITAYIMVRTQWENMTPYRGSDMVNTIKNVSAATSVTDGLDTLFRNIVPSQMSDLSLYQFLSDLYKNFTGQDISDTKKLKDKYVQRGAYRDFGRDFGFRMTKEQRALIKLTPFKNVIQQVYGAEDSRRYYQNRVMNE